ncbi:MAG: ATP synthase F1 subunit epsilon [Planctomycetes bacterium]|nr:ATP synthase F1 subunit epsilon [Planctomycetota bacterium]
MAANRKFSRGDLRCRVLTPQKLVFDEMIESAVLNTTSGTLEVYPQFEPTISPLRVGVMRTKGNDGSETTLAVHGGYMDMNGKVLVILADSAEVGNEIDVGRARQSLERARELLAKTTSERPEEVKIDADRAKLAILRAMTRLQVAGEPVAERR